VVTPSLLGIYGLHYARRHGLPAVASFHTNFASCLLYYGLGWAEPLGWRYMRWFYNQCAITLAPSRTVAEELRVRGIPNVTLWQRGVDRQRFSPSFRSQALRERIGAGGVPVLLFVGRLAREKNLDDLVEAVRVLEQRGDRFKLVLAGDGPMRRELRGRLPQAHFTGYVDGDALARWYGSADIFVLPSTIETFGNVVLEAFASGLPVVGVDRGGVRELITHGVNGLLAPPRAPAAFAELIHSLLVRPAEAARLGARARATAAHYRWPEVSRRLLATYRQLMAANGNGNGNGNGSRPKPATSPHAVAAPR
jgi:glycosyltransferase involved in cell wall biosynthesis